MAIRSRASSLPSVCPLQDTSPERKIYLHLIAGARLPRPALSLLCVFAGSAVAGPGKLPSSLIPARVAGFPWHARLPSGSRVVPRDWSWLSSSRAISISPPTRNPMVEISWNFLLPINMRPAMLQVNQLHHSPAAHQRHREECFVAVFRSS